MILILVEHLNNSKDMKALKYFIGALLLLGTWSCAIDEPGFDPVTEGGHKLIEISG